MKNNTKPDTTHTNSNTTQFHILFNTTQHNHNHANTTKTKDTWQWVSLPELPGEACHWYPMWTTDQRNQQQTRCECNHLTKTIITPIMPVSARPHNHLPRSTGKTIQNQTSLLTNRLAEVCDHSKITTFVMLLSSSSFTDTGKPDWQKINANCTSNSITSIDHCRELQPRTMKPIIS